MRLDDRRTLVKDLCLFRVHLSLTLSKAIRHKCVNLKGSSRMVIM